MDRRSFLGALAAVGILPKTLVERMEVEPAGPPTIARATVPAPPPRSPMGRSFRLNGHPFSPLKWSTERDRPVMTMDGQVMYTGPERIHFSTYGDHATARAFRDAFEAREVALDVLDERGRVEFSDRVLLVDFDYSMPHPALGEDPIINASLVRLDR